MNENDLPFILYFNIDYEMYREPLDEETAYFHACWRRENPCDGWGPDVQTNSPEVNNVTNLKGEGNYTVLDVEGTGHYVGCNLTVKHYQGSWWGEGNDMFFIDGEEYFEEIMIFEKKKDRDGLFMPDQAVETVIGQCRAFLEMGNGNYLYSTFADRVMELNTLTEKEKSELHTGKCTCNIRLCVSCV